MANTHGSLSINSDNIFPIIKKWLYSDHDIFYRELISNGCDAITKLKKLELMGEYSAPEDNKYQVKVIVSAKDKTIKFIDNGLGMTEDKLEYIMHHQVVSSKRGSGIGVRNVHERIQLIYGKQYGITKDRVRQIEVHALRKLRYPSRKLVRYYKEGVIL